MARYRLIDLQRVHIYTDPDNFVAEVSLANLGGGEIVAMCFEQRGLAHTDTGSVILLRSYDHGRTWDAQTKVVVMQHEDDWGYNSGAIACLSDGTLLCHANRWQYLKNGRIDWFFGESENEGVYLARSTDRGNTWSRPERINLAPMRNARCRDAIVELADGTLLLPLHGFRWQRTLPDISSVERERSFVLGSTDQGRTWQYYGTMGYDPAEIVHYHEPGLCLLPDGRLLGLLRTQRWPHRARAGEQMDHPSGYVFYTLSEDGGLSWSQPRNTKLWGYPSDCVALPDGTVVAAYSYRRRPFGVHVAVSPDGAVWSSENEFNLVDYDPMNVTPVDVARDVDPMRVVHAKELLWHIGYPSSVLLDDGSVMTGYHLYNADGRQYVEAAIYRVERLS